MPTLESNSPVNDECETPLHETDDATADDHSSHLEPGSLLKELEARQDEVLEQLDDLDRQICEVLRNCGVTLEDDEVDAPIEMPQRQAA